MVISTDILNLFIGWILGTASSILIEEYRIRRERERYLEEIRQERIRSAQNYYRKLYNVLQPLLIAYSKITLHQLTKIFSGEYEHFGQVQDELKNNLKLMRDTINRLAEEGDLALFPRKLQDKLVTISLEATTALNIVSEFDMSSIPTDLRKVIKDFYDDAHEAVQIIREILGIKIVDYIIKAR